MGKNQINQWNGNGRYGHRINEFRWLYLDDQDGFHTFNVQQKGLFGWRLVRTIESESESDGRTKCEQLLTLLTE